MEESDIMNKDIKNPETGNKIKVKTALQLPDDHPAKKKAKQMVDKSPSKDNKEKSEPTKTTIKTDPFVKNKEKEQHKAFVKKVGKTPQPADFDGDMDKYLDALNQHMKDVESKIDKERAADDEADDMDRDARFASDDDDEKEDSIKESKMRKYTIKEVRMWMKKLEENRYKKVYNSDARRVAWMVNNEGVDLKEMPVSMRKKWTKAEYGRERYLAKEFLKSKAPEQKLRESIRKIINRKRTNLLENKIRTLFRQVISEKTVRISQMKDANFVPGQWVQLMGKKGMVKLTKKDVKFLAKWIRQNSGKHGMGWSFTEPMGEGKLTEAKTLRLPNGTKVKIDFKGITFKASRGKDVFLDRGELAKFFMATSKYLRY